MNKQITSRVVRPILSTTHKEARRGVIALYRDFYKELEWTCRSHVVDTPIKVARERLKEEFLKHKHVTDIRVIDLLVIKGRMQLEEFHNMWAQGYTFYSYFDTTDTQIKKTAKKDQKFLEKFYESSD